ncbi:kinesin-5, putative [Plasmodium chabaudi chabaudi]|uniref:Kinesin-5, putative n=1 Tax=Plasmodium chabaudi chabaudi TaxID=31271 RepID=A0A4V0K7X9_PLACU|nr:kinesin-5, putative [Plasmodium chabaudi chabaudi]VTZ68286.1 kinesin-5, putative [Plasmodium chabaudi chabaudi]|eukprot:XP_744415.2 kinesin-5, putative [Plasmodium chabaudi chabaudi]
MLRSSYQNDKHSCVNIKVIVRCRPLNEKEKNDINNEEVVKINNNEVILTINRSNEIYEKKYSFDYACDKNVDQKTLFNNYIFQIVDEVVEGFNCTLFCYGQTGTGKTYTMEGKILEHLKNNENKKVDLNDSINSDINYYYELCDNDDTGIIFRVAKRIFDILNSRKEDKPIKRERELYDTYNYTDHDNINDDINNDSRKKGIKRPDMTGFDKIIDSYDREQRKETNSPVLSNRNKMIEEENKCTNKHYHNINDIIMSNNSNNEKSSFDFTIKVSYLEIYNEELCDLLSPTTETNHKLRIYEDTTNKNKGLNVDKLEEKCINSFEEIYYIICSAIKKRRTAETSYNKKSSRSHSIFTITLIMKDLNSEGESITKIGKLNLVDLAGSENALKSSYGNIKIRQQECCNINQSLLTLGRVINALIENSSYIPYRDSKLTRLLQDSLGGKTKTFIVATISPSSLCIDETLSTLDYVFRAKNIKNRPEINVKTTKQLKIKDLNNEIEKLKNALNLNRERRGVYLDNEEYNNIQNSLKKNKEVILEKEKILFEKSKKIKTLLNKMDYSDDVQNQVIEFLKHVLVKYKNIQSLYDIFINKIVEEKYVNQFLIDQFDLIKNYYYDNVYLFEEKYKLISEIVSQNFDQINQKINNDKTFFNDTCNNSLQILSQIKNNIEDNKTFFLKSIKGFEQLSNDLHSKKNDLLNFFLQNIDLIEKSDKNTLIIIDKVKNKLLACKVKSNTNPKSRYDHLLNAQNLLKNGDMTINDFFLYINNNIVHDLSNPNDNQLKQEHSENSGNQSNVCANEENNNNDTMLSVYQKNFKVLENFVFNEEGIELVNKISNDLSNEEYNIKNIIEYIRNISNLFHLFLKSSSLCFKKNIKDKEQFFLNEEKKFKEIIQKYYEQYNTYEIEINEKKNKIIQNYKEKINEDVKNFEQNVLNEIKNVINKNITILNEKVNNKIEALNDKLQEQVNNNKHKKLYTNSLKSLETFFYNYNQNYVNYDKEYDNFNNNADKKISKYNDLFRNVMSDMATQLKNNENKIKNNIINIVTIYEQIINKNTQNVDKITEYFDTYTNQSLIEKEQHYKNISNKISQEKLYFENAEKNHQNFSKKCVENILTYNQEFLQNLEKCKGDINSIVNKIVNQNYFHNLTNIPDPKVDDKVEIKNINENIKDIREEIKNKQALTVDDTSTINKEDPDNEHNNANHFDSDTFTQFEKKNENSDNYLDLKNAILKELENEVSSKNIDFKCLFEKINENFDFINTENTSLKRAILSGECKLWLNSSTGMVKDCSDAPSVNPNTNIGTTINNTNLSTSVLGINNEKSKIGNQNKLNANKNNKDICLKTDGDTEKNNIKPLKEQNRKRNKSIDNLHPRPNTYNNTNDMKLSATKIVKLNTDKFNSSKNSPLLKRFKDDPYKNKNIKMFRKLEG